MAHLACACGKRFVKRTNRKWCSNDCPVYKRQKSERGSRWYRENKRQWNGNPVTCECGTIFTPRCGGIPQRWCGKSCPAQKRFKTSLSSKWYVQNRAYACFREGLRRSNSPDTVRQSYLRSARGINAVDYDALLTTQGGACAICGTTTPSKRRKYFDIDHCHTTGRVRGLLCEVCNRSIGLLKDSPELLRRAAEYLER